MIISRAEARINLSNIQHNALSIMETLHEKCRMLAVVKANAYGHGAAEVATALADIGVNDFAVATADEGVFLRTHGIKGNILVLGKTPVFDRKKLADYELQQACDSVEYAKSIVENGKPAIHIKIDTGMSRLGFYCHTKNHADSCAEKILPLYNIEGINVQGIFTHFADADGESDSFTKQQFEAFCAVIDALKAKGKAVGTRHCCNSAATIRYPEMQLDMVRQGIGLYGLERSVPNFPFKPAMSVTARIAAVGELESDDTVSYGRTYKASKSIKRAVVSFGYADGMPRLLSNKYSVMVNGKKAPIIGRICMDMFMINVDGIDCNEGDEVLIFGENGEVSLMADIIGTINYEIVCGISPRVPRIYIGKEK